MFDSFWRIFQQLAPFSPKEKALIQEKLIYRDVPKHHILVDLGQIAHEMYFIQKGCIRLYYSTADGKEITGFIFEENMFTSSLESVISQIPSIQVLETLEASELVVLPYDGLLKLYEEVPKMNVVIRKILEQRMINAQKVVASLIMNKPEERYSSMLDLQPALINRIPQQVLATFLGITPVSLSRIRKRIMDQE